MNDSPVSRYLVLFRGTDWSLHLPPDEIRDIMERTNEWFDRLHRQGQAVGAHPLDSSGKTISWQNGAVSDGPFVESKESIGGYLMLAADSFEEAMAVARQNPMIQHGLQVEVRPVAEECPVVKAALAHAAVSHV